MIKIEQALLRTVLDGGLEIDLVHENGLYSTWTAGEYTDSVGPYTPDANREYLELHDFPAGIVPLSLRHTDQHVGLYQGIIKYPSDTGSIAAKRKAYDFLNLFEIGGSVSYDGQKVNMDTKYMDGGRIEGGFYQIVCRVNYRAFVTR